MIDGALERLRSVLMTAPAASLGWAPEFALAQEGRVTIPRVFRGGIMLAALMNWLDAWYNKYALMALAAAIGLVIRRQIGVRGSAQSALDLLLRSPS